MDVTVGVVATTWTNECLSGEIRADLAALVACFGRARLIHFNHTTPGMLLCFLRQRLVEAKVASGCLLRPCMLSLLPQPGCLAILI
mmetsp:Transcript_1017/g.1993  ORF Transcript_1017/g.1993 Transcript_1017/m.1993 type:complete len:86 (+) Transcript_1017:689-946(+)